MGTFLVYLTAASVLALITGQAVTDVPVWSHGITYPLWSLPIVFVFGITGVSVALLIPTIAWAQVLSHGSLRPAILFHRAFTVNLIQAIVFVGFWKASAGAAPNRMIFVAWQALVAASGFLVLIITHHARNHPGEDLKPFLAGCFVLLVLLPVFFWGKIFVENFSGDGVECFEFARSLSTHQLPYWDLENGHYGFYPEFMLFSYPLHLCMLTIGKTEAAVRLPTFFFLLGIYLVLVEIVRGSRRPLSRTEILILLLAAVFFLVFHAHHSTYEVVTDLAEPTGVDTFFTFLASSALYALLAKQRFWWGLFALLGTMALPAGAPFALAFLIGRLISPGTRPRWPVLRPFARDAAAFLIPLAVYKLLVHLYSLGYPLGTTKWVLQNIFELYPFNLHPKVALLLILKLTLLTAVIPLLALGFIPRRDRVVRTLGIALLAYLIVLAFFGRSHFHYLIPLCLFPVAILLRCLTHKRVEARTRKIVHGVYGAALVVLTLLVLPQDRTPHTAFREFGARTLMLYESYPEAVRVAARLVERLSIRLPEGKPPLPGQQPDFYFTDWSVPAEVIPARSISDVLHGRRFQLGGIDVPWGISFHTWVRYSDKAPIDGRDYDQVLAAPNLLPSHLGGYVRRDLSGGWVLHYRPQRSVFAWLDPMVH